MSNAKERRINAYKARMARRDRIKKYPPKFIKKVKWGLLYENYDKLRKNYLDNSWNTYDLTYRIYHSSFKMYGMSKLSMDIWDLLLEVFGVETLDSFDDWAKDQDLTEDNHLELRKKHHELRVKKIKQGLNKIGAGRTLLYQVSQLKNLFFTHSKNHGNHFPKDSLLLVSNYTIARQIVESAFEILMEWKEERGALFDVDRRIINEKEALVMSSLYCLSLRYMDNKKENEEKMRNYIRKVNKKEKK